MMMSQLQKRIPNPKPTIKKMKMSQPKMNRSKNLQVKHLRRLQRQSQKKMLRLQIKVKTMPHMETIQIKLKNLLKKKKRHQLKKHRNNNKLKQVKVNKLSKKCLLIRRKQKHTLLSLWKNIIDLMVFKIFSIISKED